ncbi:MAG: 50S ribosomal protein L32e [Promethearchaeota archaeon]
MVQDKRLMELRKKIKRKKPAFRRVESWRYKRVKDSWRKARGIDSKTRKKKKLGVKSPTIGYRAPKKVRGLHPSGYKEVRITTIEDLKKLNKRKHVIKISAKIGAKKRIALIDYSQKRGFKVLNLGVSQKEIEMLEEMAEAPITGLGGEELIDIDELEDSFESEDED